MCMYTYVHAVRIYELDCLYTAQPEHTIEPYFLSYLQKEQGRALPHLGHGPLEAVARTACFFSHSKVLSVVIDILNIRNEVDLVGPIESSPLKWFPYDYYKQDDEDHSVCVVYFSRDQTWNQIADSQANTN